MVDVIHTALQIIATIAFAVGFDWALQFQIQLSYVAASSGKAPQPYRVGPAHKLLLMAAYVALFNWVLFTHRLNPTLALIVVGALFLLYVADAVFLAMQMMKN